MIERLAASVSRGGTIKRDEMSASRDEMSAPPDQVEAEQAHPKLEPRPSRKERTRTVALVVLAILATLFAAKNGKEVKVDWVVGSGRAPLIIVIVVSLLAGIVLTLLAERLGRRRRR
jgi:uncharacterized integral membrane protein